jgi:hypothetical protein
MHAGLDVSFDNRRHSCDCRHVCASIGRGKISKTWYVFVRLYLKNILDFSIFNVNNNQN